MKKTLSLVMLAAFMGVLPTKAGFTPVAGSKEGAGFSMETLVSGVTIGADGTVLSHGSVPAPNGAAGVGAVNVDEGNAVTRIYSIEGILISVSQEDAPDLEMLPEGLYIVNRENRVEKIFKSR